MPGRCALPTTKPYPADKLDAGNACLAAKGKGGSAVSASAAKRAGSDTEIQIVITPPNVRNLQGYEIQRDGKAIAFVPSTGGSAVYTDVIGSGNHLAFTYTVTAYNTLGNEVGRANLKSRPQRVKNAVRFRFATTEAVRASFSS